MNKMKYNGKYLIVINDTIEGIITFEITLKLRSKHLVFTFLKMEDNFVITIKLI